MNENRKREGDMLDAAVMVSANVIPSGARNLAGILRFAQVTGAQDDVSRMTRARNV